MVWYFVKDSESPEFIVYRYSRESKELDGKIRYNKKTGIVVICYPCVKDIDSQFGQEMSVSKFVHHVVDEGFPDRRQVATG